MYKQKILYNIFYEKKCADCEDLLYQYTSNSKYISFY